MASSSPTSRPILSGKFRHALDNKNRITIPSAWRQEEGEPLFIFKNPLKPCLTVMPPEVFQAVGEEAKARIEPSKRQDFIRRFYADAQNTATDKQGRLLVAEDHCRMAALRGEVVLAGSMDRFEIWSTGNWEKFRQTDETDYAEVAKEIGL